MARAPNAVANDTAARHARALPISSQLTAYYRRTHRPDTVMVTPEPIIAALNEAGVRFVLMGTHGIGGWRDQARATQDVDVLVRKRDHKKAVAAIQRLYPALKMQDTTVVTRFLEPADNQPVIDLMKPSQAVFAMVFRNTVPVGDTHRVPNLEMALVSKFAAMTSPNRSYDKKLIDGGDFVNIVRTNRDAINLARLRKLANVVYRGGSAEIVKMVGDIKAGRRIEF